MTRGALLAERLGVRVVSFVTAIGPFLKACPGPPLAQAGLRIAALQPVKGIAGLDRRASVILLEPVEMPPGRHPSRQGKEAR